MTNRLLATVAAVALVAGACGGDGNTCGGIADEAIELVQDLIDEMDEMTLEDLAALDQSFTADFEAGVQQLVDDADGANCGDDQMTDLIRDRVGGLTSDSDVGQIFIDQFLSDDLFSG